MDISYNKNLKIEDNVVIVLVGEHHRYSTSLMYRSGNTRIFLHPIDHKIENYIKENDILPADVLEKLQNLYSKSVCPFISHSEPIERLYFD